MQARSKKGKRGATVRKHVDRKEALIGVCHRDLADGMREEITQGKGKIFGFLDKIGYTLYESKVPERYLTNVNTPDIFLQVKEQEENQG